ncbi:MAG: hypothetical protein QXQ57_05070 [Sulfolobales archaeon]
MIRVVLISSFTIDKIEIGGSTYEKIGGPAYYAGVTLAMMGLKPILITAIDPERLKIFENVLKRFLDISLINLDQSCRSIYTFRHRYDSNGRRYSDILDVGCSIELDKLDLEHLAKGSWILISPVYREVEAKDIRRIASLGNTAIDLQGFSREIEGQRVVISLNNILKNIYEIPTVSAIHLSSDDIQDVAIGSVEDLKKIRPIIEKALAAAYTIGSRGGYIHINNNINIHGVKIEREEGRGGWYYIPPYIETDRGDPTGCGDIFIASLVGSMAMGYNILNAAVRASAISGMRVSRGFPIGIDEEEIDAISSRLMGKVHRIHDIL